MASLIGQTVVIVGGSSGMGKGTAKAVRAAGGLPWIVGRDEQRLKDAAAFVGGEVKTSTVDATDEASVKSFFSTIAPGTIHHVVCSVGPGVARGNLATDELSVDAFKKQLDVKFFSAVAVSKYSAPVLADGGSIVFMSGALSRRPGKGSAPLACANAALDALARALANDFGPRLRVNCLSPGLVDTEMWDSMPPETKAGMLKGFGSQIPAGRAGTIDDIGNAAVFLLGNTWVTGVVLDVDGGAVVRP